MNHLSAGSASLHLRITAFVALFSSFVLVFTPLMALMLAMFVTVFLSKV